jgi:shikimate kinase
MQDQNSKNMTILLIGPMSAGKSTVGTLLADQLNLPRYSVDEFRWDYYNEIGYDEAKAAEIAKSDEGMAGLIRYWKPFEAHAVERMLSDYGRCVIDFGAGHSVYEDEALFARIQQVLEPYPYVILLLPSPDLDESVKIVNDRFMKMAQAEGETVHPDVLKVNEHFVRHPSNYKLAKLTVYTKAKAPEETCAEILLAIQGGKLGRFCAP